MVVLKNIVVGLLIGPVFAVVYSYPTNAQSSGLQQQIEPIECIYTTTITGHSPTLDSTCDNQPVPTVSEVIINEGSPVIIGKYQSATARSLRVWLSAQWYTNGVDPRLKTEADIWTLDLSGTVMLLSEGDYTVIVEVETIGGLLLRNTFAATFNVAPHTATVDNIASQKDPGINKRGMPSIVNFFALPSPPQSYQKVSPENQVTEPLASADHFFSPIETGNWLLRRVVAGMIGIGLISLAVRYALMLYRR